MGRVVPNGIFIANLSVKVNAEPEKDEEPALHMLGEEMG